ncbi:MAG: hypothetical protein HOP28_00480 [Gemmatimonadales bacterium]|nr:hypothetical protein [Gemmatimonadales bacterium]
MKDIPLVVPLSLLVEVLVVLAAVRYRSALPPARRWLIAMAAMWVAADIFNFIQGRRRQNNLSTTYVIAVPEFAVVMMALAAWQTSRVWAKVLRGSIPVFAVIFVLLLVFVERTDNFSLVTGPVKALLLLTAAALTLLARVREEEGDLLRRDWFWLGTSLALYYACAALIHPIARVLRDADLTLLLSAYTIKAYVQFFALVGMVVGIWLRIEPDAARSGPVKEIPSA